MEGFFIMDYILLILSVILLIMGLLGCILPILPGPPLSFIALLIIHLTRFADFTVKQLVFFGALAVFVQILDFVVPVWGTKRFGGTRAGVRGSMIGLIVGIIVLPVLGIAIGPFGLLGILGGPFAGAYIGERMTGQQSDKALRAAWGSFIGFLAGTMMKLTTSIVITIFFFKETWSNLF